jgi:hypothetical protein
VANLSAVARPMPDVAPVISIRFMCSFNYSVLRKYLIEQRYKKEISFQRLIGYFLHSHFVEDASYDAKDTKKKLAFND